MAGFYYDVGDIVLYRTRIITPCELGPIVRLRIRDGTHDLRVIEDDIVALERSAAAGRAFRHLRPARGR